jgi:plasmid stability protein
MSDSVAISIAAPEALGAAIRLRAAREGVSPEEVVQGILRKALAPELEEAAGALPLTAVIRQVMQSGGKGT